LNKAGRPVPSLSRSDEASPTELPPEEAIVFDQIRECRALSAIEPTRDGQKQQPKDRHVDHRREVISQTDEAARC